MDESGEKEMKLQMLLQSLKDLLSEYGDRSGCSEVGRTIVNGYDTKLLQDVVETALTNFASPSENKEEAVVASSKTSKLLPKKKEMKLKMQMLSLKEEAVVASSKTSKLFPKKKEMKLVSPKKKSDFHSEYAGEVGRIYVKGYDEKWLPEDVEKALRNHFSQCGRITRVYVPPCGDLSFVYFIGEGAVEKALQLNGTDVGGWTVSIKRWVPKRI